jgi:hypothetical protein
LKFESRCYLPLFLRIGSASLSSVTNNGVLLIKILVSRLIEEFPGLNLHEVEIAQMGNFLCETAEEIKSLVPRYATQQHMYQSKHAD